MSPTPRLANVVVPVTDADAHIAFYCERLGMEIRVDTPFGDGMRWVEVAPPGSATTIALAPPSPESQEGAGGRMTGITLATADIDATYAELSGAGVDVDAEIARYGDPVPPMFWFRDPEANVLLMVQEAAPA